MKQCPLCKEQFADEQNFCDADGSPLIEKVRKSPGLNAEALPPSNGRTSQVWPVVIIGILIGVIICLTAYAVMMTPPADKANNRGDSNAKLNQADRTLPATATMRSAPLPVASVAEPLPEPSATETASPTPAVAAVAQTPDPALNTGPISTDR